ncbi:MAG: FtsX-like permease family protein [Acidimicrobiales bacterium]
MIRLGLRLTLNGGREAFVRLVVTALAVTSGVFLLLVTLASMNALNSQNARGEWLNTVPAGSNGPGPVGNEGPSPSHAGQALGSVPASTANPLWWLFSTDQFGSKTIDRVNVAVTGSNSPVLPGMPNPPGPGQFYASPALTSLLRTTPADELGARFPGKQIGVIGASALPSPDSLIIVVGYSVAQLSHAPGAAQVSVIQNGPANMQGPQGYDAGSLEAILAIGALALLLPVVIFIGTATRLSATRREQRFAAMRLVGATPRQVSVVSAVEASIAALGGVALGFLLFYLLHPMLQHFSLTGRQLAPGDLSLKPGDIIAVCICVPVAAAVAARVALRRVVITPLGVNRRVTPPAPRAYRVIPLFLGIAELSFFVVVGPPKTTGGQIDAYLLGFVLLMAGLVYGGPWLTMVGSRVMARRSSRPSVLIAGRRLSDNPRGAFRSISGLILALFVTSVAAGVITTIVADHGSTDNGVQASDTLIDQLGNPASGQETPSVASVASSVLSNLHSIGGVEGVTLVYVAPASTPTDGPIPDPDGVGGDPQVSVVSCAQLATTPVLGRCAAGAQVAAVETDFGFVKVTKGTAQTTRTVWPDAAISLQRLVTLPVQTIAVATDGSASSIARAQTVLETAFPLVSSPSSFGAVSPKTAATMSEFQHLTDVVIVVSLIVAGCSLAVTMAGGLSDRRRPFVVLRLTGVPLSVLRSVVALETAVPLVIVAVLSAGVGLLASDLFLRSQLGVTLRAPGVLYYVTVLGGLVAALGIVATTLPLMERITRPDNARVE